MIKITVEQFIEEYEKHSEILWAGELSEKPNFKKMDKARDYTYDMWDQYKNYTDFMIQCIEVLKKSENPSSRLDAANYSLHLNYKVDEAIDILETIDKGHFYGLSGFAYIILHEWNKKNNNE